MNKKAEGVVGKVMVAVIAIIMFALIWNLQTSATNFIRVTDTAEIAQNIPFNITLSGNDPQTIFNVTNGTGNMEAANYTDYLSDGFLQINDNTSYTGTVSVIYDDQHIGYITGAISQLIVGFIAVMLVVGIIVYLVKKE